MFIGRVGRRVVEGKLDRTGRRFHDFSKPWAACTV
jgi:hypothetical protein